MAQGKTKLTGSVQSNKSVALFERIIAQAYGDILSTFSEADLNDKIRRKAILTQLDGIVASTHIDLNAWAVTQIPAFYEAGAFSVAKDLINGGQKVDLTRQFATFHAEAVASLINQTSSDIASAMEGLKKTTNTLITQATRDGLLEKVATGAIKGSTRKEVTKGIVSELKKNGITSLVDKGGKSWDLNRYGAMLARTKLTQAQNQGVAMRVMAEGNDLVIVSDHMGECDLCRPWENKILSVSGKSTKYESLDKAMGAGLFHPNCRHVVSAVPSNQEYLNNSLVWDGDRGEYVPFDGINNGIRTDKPGVGKEITIGKNSKVYRAVDSNDGNADLGTGTYFAFKKDYAARYGADVREFTIKPGAKMLQLDGYNSIDQLAEYARKADKEAFLKLVEEHGMEGAIPRSITKYAKGLGYDGIIGDDEVFGSVLFDRKMLLSANSLHQEAAKKVVAEFANLKGAPALKLSDFQARVFFDRGITFAVDNKTRTKRTNGYYMPGFKKIVVNKVAIKENPVRTFYHELGHAIDANYTTGPLKESGILSKVSRAEHHAIVKDRLARTQERYGLNDEDMMSVLTGATVYRELENGGKTALSLTKKHRAYLYSNEELYADAYAQYTLDPVAFKAYAPEMYKYFKTIEKEYGN